ncbi:mitochondrial genome maintenance exonuclease 1-like [Dendronephthya gigantea]|uniref:mitochondrial genome maintenance exonuclease 1-like n=1 Tax=Dendronephthya gigantea TaxID=151771 RepID=UPI00106B9065|nr:mitochondrial genome maintenance exonuclease 1-like [Dendronephthya gigantea]
MKIVKILNRFSFRCKVFQYKPLFHNLTHAASSTYHDRTKDSTPFMNPNRQQNQCNLDVRRTDFPLQVSLSATKNNNGRVYSGDHPSVTTILDQTRPKNEFYALLSWRRGLIKKLGVEGYNDKVMNITNRGTTFHQAIKHYLLTRSQPSVRECNLGHWKSVQNVLKDIELVVALESGVVHPQLRYAGTLDGIVVYQGKLCVIEWKTSERKRTEPKDCFSYPHQTVAYAGAVNYDQNYHPLQIDHGLIVLAYLDGSPADVIWLRPETCEYYWNEWLRRIQEYNHTNASNMHQGRPIRELAQYVNGISHHQPVLYGNSNIVENANIAEWSETIVDVFETDPSICEFDETEYS